MLIYLGGYEVLGGGMLITCSFTEAPEYSGKKYSIANSQPKPPMYQEKKYLAPDWNLVCRLKNGMLDGDTFTEKYLTQLRSINPINMTSLERDLDLVKSGTDLVYLCWEPLGQFCHRHILVNWLIAEKGLDPKLCIRR